MSDDALTEHPLHSMWRAMISRCHSPADKDYQWYGGRERRPIRVARKWHGAEGFYRFVEHVGPRPDGHQLDRIDNNKGYQPGNVRWVTSKTNNNNRRDNKMITYRGKTMSASMWADETGIPRQQISNRINRGWSVKDALTIPMKAKAKPLLIDGVSRTATEWAHLTGRKRTTIVNRIRRGMSAREAVFGELERRFDGICPRCVKRPRTDSDHYCAPCRREYMQERV